MFLPRSRNNVPTALLVIGLLVALPAALMAEADLPRTASGRPNLSGNYNAATLTPFERPVAYGDKLLMTREEAEKIAADQAAFRDNALRDTDGDREAPAVGGAAGVGFEENRAGGEALGAGNVGGYNWFWVDPGSDAFEIDGRFRTSILIDPLNGRMPPLTEEAKEKRAKRFAGRRSNDGTAWWLEREGPGPYDDMELRPLAERCIVGFTGSAPTFPSLYNNYKRIVQTEDHVMILIEMVHDARIVRLNSEHAPAHLRKWLGDSIGWWEDDTLVVDTTNFHPQSALRGGSMNMHVVERFSQLADGSVLYQFTVEDDTVWTAPWTGEYIWQTSDQRVYEYACHEGNYSFGNIMRGARLLENESLAAKSAD